MYYQTKFKYTYVDANSRTRKKTAALLINAETFGDAEAQTYEYCKGFDSFDIISVSRSPIREVANPHFYERNETAWIVTLEEIYLQDDGKEKKLRYPVLFWSTDMPNATDKMVKDYCLQIDPNGNTMKVVAVKKSDIAEEL